MKNVNQLIGCCGLDCEKCDARIATLTNDNAMREKTAVLWTKLNVVTITPEMINCIGCRIEGAKTPFCDKLCPVHNCVREKGLDTCADCGQMDGCPTLGQIAVNSPFVLENLKKNFSGDILCFILFRLQSGLLHEQNGYSSYQRSQERAREYHFTKLEIGGYRWYSN